MAPGYGFLLVVFEYKAGGQTLYASSAERKDVVRLLNEFLQRATSEESYGQDLHDECSR
jgi:hypothetical protein